MSKANVGFRGPFEAGIEELRHKWGWCFALGVAVVILGATAASVAVATTVASVLVFGFVLVVAGVVFGALAFLTGRWSGFFLSLGAGILSVITGIMLLRSPLAGAAVLTMVIASYFLVGGSFRAIGSIVMQFPNWGWSLISGLVTVALGGMLISGWPLTSLWFLGFYVGIDLMVHGFAWCMFALSIRGLAQSLDRKVDRAA